MSFGQWFIKKLRNVEIPLLGLLSLIIGCYTLYQPSLNYDSKTEIIETNEGEFGTDISQGFKLKHVFSIDIINNGFKPNSLEDVDFVPLTFDGNIEQLQKASIQKETIWPFQHKRIKIAIWYKIKEMFAVRDPNSNLFNIEGYPIRCFLKDKYGNQIKSLTNHNDYAVHTTYKPVITWITNHIDSIHRTGLYPANSKYYFSVDFNESGGILHMRYTY